MAEKIKIKIQEYMQDDYTHKRLKTSTPELF